MFNMYIPFQIRHYMSTWLCMVIAIHFFFNFIKHVNSKTHKEDVNSYNGWICKTLFRSDAWLVGVLWRGVVRGVSVPRAGLVRRGWFISEVI